MITEKFSGWRAVAKVPQRRENLVLFFTNVKRFWDPFKPDMKKGPRGVEKGCALKWDGLWG